MPSSAGKTRTIADVVDFLSALAPLSLAESWDNVGLLWGDAGSAVQRVVTCLTLTADVAAEAEARKAELVISHHPILFRPVQRLTSANREGQMLLRLARLGIAVYSAHTAYDSAADGINRQLAESLGLESIAPLRPKCDGSAGAAIADESAGSGRMGDLRTPLSLTEFLSDVKARLAVPTLDFVGASERRIRRVAIACGAAAEFMDDAIANGCDALVTGEARFHACLEARERGLVLLLLGHFASERPGVVQLAHQISHQFPELEAWASESETDPINRA